jgi:hypothetical protein
MQSMALAVPRAIIPSAPPLSSVNLVTALAFALNVCFAPPPAETPARGSIGVAVGGKARRGRLACTDQPEYRVHMLIAVLHDLGIVLARRRLTTRERKPKGN